MTDEQRAHLRTIAESAGGADALSRKIDVPGDTLRRAMAGERLRKGTRLMIEAEIAKAEQRGGGK